VIRGQQVVLRSVEERDHPLIRSWLNDPEIRFWLDEERPVSSEDVAERERAAKESGHPFVIEIEGTPIGRIELFGFLRRDRRCSIRVLVGDPRARGRGYGSEAIALLAGYAFDRWDLASIEAITLATNVRAIAAMERCGFVREAVLPERSWKDGAWHDHVVLRLTREGLSRNGQ
jgi:RimJ/RimL family protein N-acetyltransferase